VNPYISTIRHALDQVENETIPVGVELLHLPAGRELAAIINTQNLSTVHPRKVVFFRSGADAPRYVHILSRHYEPLQYPLLFSHSTPGWGYSSIFPFPERVREGDRSDLFGNETCRYTQIQWYRHLLLTEPRFLTIDRLTCEYVVDMYSRTEEARLAYLKLSRAIQSSAFENNPRWPAADLDEAIVHEFWLSQEPMEVFEKIVDDDFVRQLVHHSTISQYGQLKGSGKVPFAEGIRPVNSQWKEEASVVDAGARWD
jgi:hypothetical protein